MNRFAVPLAELEQVRVAAAEQVQDQPERLLPPEGPLLLVPPFPDGACGDGE